MAESVVADFVARARYDRTPGADALRTRVLLSEQRLVLVSDAGRTAIPLSAVVDVVASGVPEELGGFFDQSVLVAYEDGDHRRTAVVTGDHEPVERFALFLYKAALRGEGARLRHPVSVGGRAFHPTPRPVAVAPSEDGVTFTGEDMEVRIGLGDVVNVEQTRRTIEGRDLPVLAITHHVDGHSETTEVLHENPNHLTLLARHLRTEYEAAAEVLEELDLARPTLETLVALYSGVEPTSLGDVVSGNADSTALLDALASAGLLADRDHGTLTHQGALVAIHRIDTVEE